MPLEPFAWDLTTIIAKKKMEVNHGKIGNERVHIIGVKALLAATGARNRLMPKPLCQTVKS